MAVRISAVKTTFFGKGAIRMLIPELGKLHARRAMIVTDSFLYSSGAAKRVGDVLSEAGLEYLVFYKVKPNPTVEIVNECIETAKKYQVDILVALGGGSAIDTAKATSIVAANGGKVQDYEGVDKSEKPGLPIIAVNTTAGTGSECTTYYIVTDPLKHSKMAMLDPATGMDALTHAIEAVLAKGASPVTDKDALWAITAVHDYLPAAYHDGKNEEARTMMAYAENVAGMAFSNAGLGMVHAMAHALGGFYNLPHGLCNAVLLPYVLMFTASKAASGNHIAEGFCKMAGAMHLCGKNGSGSCHCQNRNGGCCVQNDNVRESASAVITEIIRMNMELGIAGRLSELKGVDPKDFSSLAKLAMHDSCMASNPVLPEEAEVISVYTGAFNGLN